MGRKGNPIYARRKYYTCPKCEHTFRLRSQSRTAKCPQCKSRFSKLENEAINEAKEQALARYRHNKRQRILKQNSILIKPQDTSAIRGDQIPNVPAEAAFKSRAIGRGYTVHRPSWPDYLLEKDGKLMHVEVKGAGDEISKEQALTFTLLERHGIPVYIWKDCKETRGQLIRWGDGIEAKRMASKDYATRFNAVRRLKSDIEYMRANK